MTIDKLTAKNDDLKVIALLQSVPSQVQTCCVDLPAVL